MSTEYFTKDINQAAFVWSQPGVRQVEDFERDGSVYFKFALPISNEELNSLLYQFKNGEATVEPKGFCSKQESLRQTVRERIRSRR